MPIKVYQSKRNKKLYEVYIGIRFKGERLQTRRRKDFQGNFISSLPAARKVEFELKRELLAQKEGQPIWKWKDWLEECLKRMRFSLKYFTVLNYEKLLGKWVPQNWDNEELQNFTKADIHSVIFEGMRAATPNLKSRVHKMLMRVFQLALEDGLIARNPAKGIKISVPPPEQKVLTFRGSKQTSERSSTLPA